MTIETPDKTFTLQRPVTVKGQTYNSIGVRRPKVKDLRWMTGPAAISDPIRAQASFLGALSELPPEVFEELDLDDADQFTAYTDSFMKTDKQPAS